MEERKRRGKEGVWEGDYGLGLNYVRCGVVGGRDGLRGVRGADGMDNRRVALASCSEIEFQGQIAAPHAC